MTECAGFGAANTSPAAARAFVRRTLRAWGLTGLAENAELIVSELVTNAVKAAYRADQGRADPHAVNVELHADEKALRIAVHDTNTNRPVPQVVDEDAEGGRGLLIVEVCSARWDVVLNPAHGKTVWAELDLCAAEMA
ncbi:ATP-binding protein [Actinacidiphila acididurans]|uniref:ATP-binding protein n=1 Tax=Actinacidiphila acididurans TaxID=2784346 RepID=A0ABS2U0B7_9ACTN|nr:ATP-binding protein [Actinacidiphila acididurans]MBM9509035.1 ATP-binding protein [Actinacidiphila acididurans]